MTGRKRLSGRVALVTGAGKGIGRAEALLLAQEGARVVVADIGADDGRSRARAVAAEIADAGGEAIPFEQDISTFDGAEALVAAAIAAFGRVDALVNNATMRGPGPLDELSEDVYESVMGANFKATLATIRAAAPHFKAQRSGAIVNTGSESGLGQAYNAVYAASKEAVASLTRCTARELGHHGVRCNVVRPRAGGTQPEGFWSTFEEHAEHIEALGNLSMGRVGVYAGMTPGSVPVAPEFVAPFVVWLCTDAARVLNGRDFLCFADQIGLYSEPDTTRVAVREGGWSLDSLDACASQALAAGLTDEFLLSDAAATTGAGS